MGTNAKIPAASCSSMDCIAKILGDTCMALEGIFLAGEQELAVWPFL